MREILRGAFEASAVRLSEYREGGLNIPRRQRGASLAVKKISGHLWETRAKGRLEGVREGGSSGSRLWTRETNQAFTALLAMFIEARTIDRSLFKQPGISFPPTRCFAKHSAPGRLRDKSRSPRRN